MKVDTRGIIAALALALVIVVLTAPRPLVFQQAYVGVIGCSFSRDVELSYKVVSSRDVTWSAAKASASLDRWAKPTAWGTFDANVAQFGQPTAVWWPLCILMPDVQTLDAAWAKFLNAHTLLRARVPTAPLYVTPTMGVQPDCATDNLPLQIQLVDKATLEVNPDTGQPYAIRSLPDIPPASAPNADGCHFNPVASTNVGQAAVEFLDQ